MLSKNGVGHKCAPTARLNMMPQCTELHPLLVDLPIRTAVAIFFKTYARHLKIRYALFTIPCRAASLVLALGPVLHKSIAHI